MNLKKKDNNSMIIKYQNTDNVFLLLNQQEIMPINQ